MFLYMYAFQKFLYWTNHLPFGKERVNYENINHRQAEETLNSKLEFSG